MAAVLRSYIAWIQPVADISKTPQGSLYLTMNILNTVT